MDILKQVFNWDALPGHIAYAIIATSYLLTNIFWLRVAAVFGIAFEILYFFVSGTIIWPSILWDSAFIVINLVQLLVLVRDRMSLKLTPDQRAFIAPIVGDLDKAQIAQLLRTGEWQELPAGTVLTIEGEAVKDLTFICKGRTEVSVREQVIAHVGAGAFIGDVSFTTGIAATASVVVDETARVISFDQDRLRALCARDEQIASALYHRIGGGLAEKMRLTTGKLQG